MTLRTPTFYAISCDAPGCKRATDDDAYEYSAWATADDAEADWSDHDGVRTGDGHHFCWEHAPTCPTCRLRLDDDGKCEDCDDADRAPGPAPGPYDVPLPGVPS